MRSRRSVLAALGSGLAALAGCNAADDTATTDSSTPTATTTSTPPATSTTTTSTETTATDDVVDCETSWGPEPSWTVEGPAVGGPHVASGRVHAVVADELRAFASSDGAVQWRQPVPDGSVYAVSGGVLFAGDGGVTAFDAASGERLWSFTLPGETRAKWAAVAVHDDTAYVAAAQAPTASTDPDTVYGRLYRFALRSGDQRGVDDLTPDGDEAVDWLKPLSVLADDTGVYVTRETGGVLGATHDGSVRWRREGDDWYYEAVRAGGVLVQPQSRQVTALDVETGETAWTDDRLDMQVAAADDVVYGTSGGSPQTYATVTAVDAITGDARWTSKLDGCGGSIVAGGGVVATGVGCRKSRVDLYDATTGCRYDDVDGSPDAQPGLAVGDGTLYATRHADTDELVALPLP
ncbi:outer membrane protein assembly factor BamB family protein [Halobacterium rubrum]|uniref:outer membrane protein assembly factor BamB family protein n=1 Tax=Halobacterium TaxID=2239 RepID=UPI001F320BC3|nr:MULTISPECIES: PQQ-binding-like beta-propeller repeat protein [Halobacterium]MDH5020591.1 PQQ-binding-like beta-propeller repeat protein [Halobacterium rubrum]